MRRPRAILAFLALAWAALWTLPPAGADWTDAHGTLSTDGRSDSGTRHQPEPMIAPPFRLRWSYASFAGCPTPPPVSATPTPTPRCAPFGTCTPRDTPTPYGRESEYAAVQDQYATVAYGNVYVGSWKRKRIVAWNLATGEPLPGFFAKAGPPPAGDRYIRSSPCIAGGIVYVGTDHHWENPENVFAYDAFTGEVVAGFPVRTDASGPETGRSVQAPPIVRDGRLYVAAWPLSSGPRIIAYDAADGQFLWSYEVAQGGKIMGAPAAAGGRIYFATDQDDLFALDAATGAPFWSAPVAVGGAVVSAPTVYDGYVYVGTQFGTVRAFNQVTQAPRPGYPVRSLPWGEIEGGLCIAADRVFAGSYDFGFWAWSANTGNAYSGSRPIEAAPGYPVWSNRPIHSAPAYCAGHVYYGSDDNVLRCVNAATGEVAWSYQLPRNRIAPGGNPFEGFDRSSVAISDGALVATSDEGNGVFVFEPLLPEPTPTPARVVLHAWQNLIVPGESAVRFTWDLPGRYEVTLAAYNSAGERVRTLFSGECPAPACEATWNGFSDGGGRLASGVYVAALSVRGRGVYRVRVALLHQTP